MGRELVGGCAKSWPITGNSAPSMARVVCGSRSAENSSARKFAFWKQIADAGRYEIRGSLLATVGLVGISSVALAETPPPRVGFQMDIRTGYALPMGTFAENVKMSDIASGQVPFIVDIGGKVIPELFIGGYLGLAFGREAGKRTFATIAIWTAPSSISISVRKRSNHILPGGSGQSLDWLRPGLRIARHEREQEWHDDELQRRWFRVRTLHGWRGFSSHASVRGGPVRRPFHGHLQHRLEWRHDHRERHARMADARSALRVLPVSGRSVR